VAEALNSEAGLPPGTTWLSCVAAKMAMVVLTCPRSHPGQAYPPGGGKGKLLSPTRRRQCVEHIREGSFGVGKIIGMIGLGNKDGEYTDHDQLALGTLVPVVDEALMAGSIKVLSRAHQAI
jgi:hypothetical protein